ncbi:AtzE family amidohydrolase [Acuticoccus sediminis]|uniref:AtzE family amidohydrolase n=1 Tax=Acuticoccus sediminis TaxID=2184697 RepID=A0A8B2NPX7_9HYPH|nr:AtzE family amidohydrolase [Acuticoccus sediminis]
MKALDAATIARSVAAGATRARDVVDASLERIEAGDGAINAFTAVTAERARARADAVDADVAAGRHVGPLAGVPFAAKNLFDVAGLTTVAGSVILADNPPAAADAQCIADLEAAGAVLVGALNMEELAYGFLTDNAHYGRTHNPVDTARTAGGSSGGSGAAVAAGFVPLTLGSDTNGSVRIPAAFCGVVGLKPTYGRISRRGMVLLAPSQDHVGWLANTVDDVAAAWRVSHPSPGALATDGAAPREATIGLAGGYFAELMSRDVRAAVTEAAELLGPTVPVEFPEPDMARAAAYAITSIEASSLRMDDLRRQPERFDPATRDRFLAGALLPAHWYVRAQVFRDWLRARVRELFERVDVVMMPANPFPAPRFGEEEVEIDGAIHPVRPTIGRFTQAVSSLGLPIVCVPVARPGALPVGVQLMGRPDSEPLLLDVARRLEGAVAARNAAAVTAHSA